MTLKLSYLSSPALPFLIPTSALFLHGTEHLDKWHILLFARCLSPHGNVHCMSGKLIFSLSLIPHAYHRHWSAPHCWDKMHETHNLKENWLFWVTVSEVSAHTSWLWAWNTMEEGQKEEDGKTHSSHGAKHERTARAGKVRNGSPVSMSHPAHLAVCFTNLPGQWLQTSNSGCGTHAVGLPPLSYLALDTV